MCLKMLHLFQNVVLSECDINFQPILKINKKEEDSKYDSPRAAAVARHIEGVVREMIEESKHQLTGQFICFCKIIRRIFFGIRAHFLILGHIVYSDKFTYRYPIYAILHIR